jgi:transmembrane sensor
MQGTALDRDRILTEAADWLANLNSSHVGPAISRDFVSWMMRSSDHLDEYLRVSRVYGDMSNVQGLPSKEELAQEVREADDDTNVIKLHTGAPLDTTARAGGVEAGARPQSAKLYRFGFRLAICASVVLAAILAGWLISERWGYPAAISTPVGEQRSLSLADGSMVHLNTDTSMTVQLSSQERRVRLKRGEARFTVAKDASRPFIVTTPQAIVRALGTAFNVRIMEQRTVVSVLEGHVDVTWRDKTGAGHLERGDMATVLGPNHQAAVIDGKIEDKGGPPFDRVLQWSQRRLLVREEPLADVVAEFNRYHTTSVLIADDDLRDLQISGDFNIDDRETLLAYLKTYEGVSVVQDSGAFIVRQDKTARRNP